MTGFVLALLLVSQTPRCVGPNCPPTFIASAVSPDTEVVQRIWISNEARWGVGVIRGGRFVAAVEPAPAPAPAVEPDAGTVGDVLNYGILKDSRSDVSQQGYMSNDPSFRPPVHDPPAPPSDSNPLINAAGLSLSFVLILTGIIVIFAAKGRRQ